MPRSSLPLAGRAVSVPAPRGTGLPQLPSRSAWTPSFPSDSPQPSRATLHVLAPTGLEPLISQPSVLNTHTNHPLFSCVLGSALPAGQRRLSCSLQHSNSKLSPRHAADLQQGTLLPQQNKGTGCSAVPRERRYCSVTLLVPQTLQRGSTRLVLHQETRP